MAGQMGMGPMGRSATKKKPKGRKGKNGKRKPVKQRQHMPGMGAGMPNMAELQKMQEQMGMGGGMPGLGGMKLPKGLENIDLNNLDFGQGKK